MQTKISLMNPQQIPFFADSILLDTLFYMTPLEKRLIKFNTTNADVIYPSEITIIQEMIIENIKKQKTRGGFTFYFTN